MWVVLLCFILSIVLNSERCYVMFVGQPEAPGGPVEVSEITEDSCVVSWKAPLEDGGSAVTHYLVEKQDKTKSDSEWQTVSKYCRTTSHEVSDLTDGKYFYFLH